MAQWSRNQEVKDLKPNWCAMYYKVPRRELKGFTKFWYGAMNLVQINILKAYAILQYSVIVVVAEIESKVMKL